MSKNVKLLTAGVYNLVFPERTFVFISVLAKWVLIKTTQGICDWKFDGCECFLLRLLWKQMGELANPKKNVCSVDCPPELCSANLTVVDVKCSRKRQGSCLGTRTIDLWGKMWPLWLYIQLDFGPCFIKSSFLEKKLLKTMVPLG